MDIGVFVQAYDKAMTLCGWRKKNKKTNHQINAECKPDTDLDLVVGDGEFLRVNVPAEIALHLDAENDSTGKFLIINNSISFVI